jgi:hypothetical protein
MDVDGAAGGAGDPAQEIDRPGSVGGRERALPE